MGVRLAAAAVPGLGFYGHDTANICTNSIGTGMVLNESYRIRFNMKGSSVML